MSQDGRGGVVVEFPVGSEPMGYRDLVMLLGEAARASISAEDPIGETKRLTDRARELSGRNPQIEDICTVMCMNSHATWYAILAARRQRRTIIGRLRDGKAVLRDFPT